ncbi:MAG TPA: LuxR C-terminal-related transcriptional regulator [Herpetosiphonaceae bacterium]
MGHTRARVDGATLVAAGDVVGPITVGTPAWFTWLEEATAFTFTSPAGSFNARKERRIRGGWYWKAYRTVNGTLHRAYLGKRENLTLDQLERAAVKLATAATPVDVQVIAPPSAPATTLPRTLLATKLGVPPVRAHLVPRPRLLDRLQHGIEGKLTLISAPAGFGKTTVVSAWIAGCGRPVAWLSLDERDSDLMRFLTHLIAALQTIAPTIGAELLGVLQSAQPPPAEAILTALLNDIAAVPDSFVLVLDDYHVLDAKPVDQALAFLIEHLPPQAHLLIATREDPLLPLARFRTRSHMTELRAADLRFSSAEAAAFLNHVMGLDLSADEIAALESHTEGWIAGLQLAALSLQGHSDATSFIQSFTGSHHFVLDYLVEEVLNQQPERVQTFLLRTSILDRLCGSLCDAVLGDPAASGQATLEYLDHANLFIVPLDNERRWYRYHHLFADLLRQRLHQLSASSPEEEVTALHRRASVWYEDHALELEAFQHAAAAQDVARAERLIDGTGVPLYFRGTITPVLRWLESLPKAALDARPSLWIMYASALLFVDYTRVEPKLQAAEAALAQRAPGSEPDDRTRDLLGRIASLRATVAVIQQDGAAIVAQSQRALEFLHPDNRPLRTAATWSLGYAYQLQGDRAAASRAYHDVIASGELFGDSSYTLAATINLGQVQEADTQLQLATRTYQHVLDMAGDPPQPMVCNAQLGLARICYQWNDLQAAAQYGHQCAHLLRQMTNVDTFASYQVFLARLNLAQGNVPGAVAVLAEAEAYVRQHAFLFRLPEVAAAKVRLLLHQGQLGLAAQLAQSHDLPRSLARVRLAQGDTATALAVLGVWRRLVETKGWADERLKVIVVEALAYQAHGNMDSAVDRLVEALVLAEPGGFIRLFVDEGPPMAALLAAAAHRTTTSTYVRHVRAAFGQRAGRTPRPERLVEPLSERERDVLRLLGTDLNGPELARSLMVSLSTLRTHTRNIYAKLGVTSRRAAVRRAEELDLV